MIEVSLEPREGLASQERGVLSASRGLDSQDLQAPKVNWQDEPNDEWAPLVAFISWLISSNNCGLSVHLYLNFMRTRGNKPEHTMRVSDRAVKGRFANELYDVKDGDFSQ